MKFLLGLDYDNTIVDHSAATRISIQPLFPDWELPIEVLEVLDRHGYDAFVKACFKHLHKIGVTRDQIVNCLSSVKAVSSIPELFRFAADNGGEIIVISDSTVTNVECGLEGLGLRHLVSDIYSNPSGFTDGGEFVYHDFPEKNPCAVTGRICKGDVLRKHVERGEYDFVIFCGDGNNDLCPMMRLSETDLAFPRIGHTLERMLRDKKTAAKVRARVNVWKDGHEIIDAIKARLEHRPDEDNPEK